MLFDPERCRNESEVESKFLVHYLLPALGYSPDSWFQEVTFGRQRLDFLAFARRSQGLPRSVRLVLEAKHPRCNLDHSVLKLRSYLRTWKARYGLLTNGKRLRLYEMGEELPRLIFECRGSEVPAHLPFLKNLIGHNPLPSTEDVQPPVRHCRKDKPMQTIAVYHNKGGVGKTTTVINLAATLRKKGLRILVIDLDAQANTTFATGLVRFDDEENDDLRDRNIGQVLGSEELFSIAEVVRKSHFCTPEIDVLPAHISLMQREIELNQIESSRLNLLSKLKEVKDNYDLVLIDTPPSLNLYARIALIAADHLIIPSDLKPFANQGLVNVLGFVRGINDFRRQIQKAPLNILGVLPSKLSTNSMFVQSTLVRRCQLIEARYGVRLMKSRIFEREDLAKCTEQIQRLGDEEFPSPQSILDYRPTSQAAQDFQTLADEVMGAVGLDGGACA